MACSIALCVLVVAIVAIYAIAFSQGRSVSFWPPNIGPKPSPAETESKTVAPARPVSHTDSTITAGTAIKTSSGKIIVTETDSYQGVGATLIRAKDSSGRALMMKLFWKGLNPSSSAWTEFSREYKAADGLQHRNIVELLDRGLWQSYPFVVMEFFAGGTLYDVIRNRDQISGREILPIAEQIAAGIDYAHSQGRIHRDISPSNVLLESDANGRVAISDFGIAKVMGALHMGLTASAPIFEGTPAYTAPEVFSGSITPAVDIYGFGAILFEMIAGQPPYSDFQSMYQMFEAKVNRPPPRVSTNRNVPAALDQRIFETLSVNPAARPVSARAVLSGMEKLILEL